MAASLTPRERNFPFRPRSITLLCLTFSVVYVTKWTGACAEEDGEWGEHLLCRNCGHEVAKASDLISVPSHHAIYQRNETIMGVEDVLIQYFRNPAGMHFELITTSSAVVDTSSKAYPADTWFDNFTWKMVKCRRCYVHLGWCYEPGENLKAKCRDCEDTNRAITERLRFYGLILDKIIHQEWRSQGIWNNFLKSGKRGFVWAKTGGDADSLVMSPKFYGG